MASGTATFALAGDILKDDYQPVIREQLNDTFMLLAQIESRSDDIEGTEAVVAIHTQRNPGVGARAENADLPTAGHQATDVIRVPLKYNYARFAVSGPMIEASASNRGSFDRIVEFNSKRIVVDLRREVNRQLYTPASGVIATVVSSDAPGSPGDIVVQNETEALYFEVGGIYSVQNGTGDTSRGTFVVSDIDEVNATITTTSNIPTGTTANDTIVRQGVVPSQNDELTGLVTQVDSTGTLHGLAATGVWKSYEEAVNAAPADAVFQRAMDRVHVRSGGDIKLVITTHGVVRAYAASLVSQKRYSADREVQLKGGFDGISINAGRGSVTLVPERDCPSGTAFLLTPETWYQYEMSDWSFMDRDGSVFQRITSKDAYEATLYKYHELVTDARNQNAKLTGLTEA